MKRILERLLAPVLAAALAASVVAIASPLNITGTNTENRASIFQMGVPRITRDESITATASGSISTSYQLTAGISYITTVASSGDSVKLPITTPGGTGPVGGGLQMVIINAAASNSLNIFPFQAADTINAISAGSAYALAAGKTAICYVGIDGKWFCVVSA